MYLFISICVFVVDDVEFGIRNGIRGIKQEVFLNVIKLMKHSNIKKLRAV
jgi:hypothetical protein